MYAENNSGPRQEPCGTPLLALSGTKGVSFTLQNSHSLISDAVIEADCVGFRILDNEGFQIWRYLNELYLVSSQIK